MQLAVSTSPSHVILRRRKNVWYSVCDGNWTNPNIWISNALDKKVITIPQLGDDVYINHSINFDAAFATNTVINNLSISGKLTASNNTQTLTVNGNLQATGFIDFTGSNITLNLNGFFNSAISSNFIGGNSTVVFGAINDQNILPLPYNNLSTSGIIGTKYMTSDLIISGNFNPQSNFECSSYSLTVNGNSIIGAVGFYKFSKSSSTGNLLFIGNVDFEGGVDLSTGNPNIEFRGSITVHTFSLISGSGVFTFSTNNQTLNYAANLNGTWNASIIVSGSITLTLTGTGILQVNNIINGTVAGSTFNNEGVLYLGNSTPPMLTGIFNYNHISTSTIGYVFNGSSVLPQTSYSNLVIGGTGVKTQLGNTSVSNNFTNNGSYECGGFNLTVSGTFTNTTLFTASTFCNIIINGLASFSNSGSSTLCMDLRGGNPNVEFKNGLDIHAAFCYTGNGIFKFSTNNQALSFSAYNNGLCAANILISGAITLTFTSGAIIPDCFGTLNGDNTSSTFDNRGTFAYTNTNAPMATGKLYCNQATNTFLYDLLGAQDITVPSDATPGYKNLILQGSGAKKLLGNISVKGSYTLNSPATLNLNGFTLTNP
jgi:hypothetical protein